MTCGREEMKRYMQLRTEPRKLPVVFSVEEGAMIRALNVEGAIPASVMCSW